VFGGQSTTVGPTIIPNPSNTGSVTAYVFGPGSTLVVGGAPITISGSVLNAPVSVSGGVGGAIMTGLGSTGPAVATGLASTFRRTDIPMWTFATAAGVMAALAFGL
jgi:hypothetical protein